MFNKQTLIDIDNSDYQRKRREGQFITWAGGGQKNLLLVGGGKGEPPYWWYFLRYASILPYWLFNWFVLKDNFFIIIPNYINGR